MTRTTSIGFISSTVCPQVDCAQNPEDPLCETATIPEAGDEGSDNGGGEEDDAGEDSSSDDGSGNNPDEG